LFFLFFFRRPSAACRDETPVASITPDHQDMTKTKGRGQKPPRKIFPPWQTPPNFRGRRRAPPTIRTKPHPSAPDPGGRCGRPGRSGQPGRGLVNLGRGALYCGKRRRQKTAPRRTVVPCLSADQGRPGAGKKEIYDGFLPPLAGFFSCPAGPPASCLVFLVPGLNSADFSRRHSHCIGCLVNFSPLFPCLRLWL
jgi:hypothetical protein